MKLTRDQLDHLVPRGQIFFTISECLPILGICRSKFYEDVADGLGPEIIKFGRRTKITRAALLDRLVKVLETQGDFRELRTRLKCNVDKELRKAEREARQTALSAGR